MAGNFQIWERSIAPAGEFVVPQGTTMGEAVGAGLEDLGEAGERVALAERNAQDAIQQKNDAAWLGKQKPQAIIDLDKTVGDLQGDAEAGAPGHVDQVAKAVDDYTAGLLKQAPDDRTKAEIESYMGSLKASYLGQAGQFQKASELAQRGQHIDEARDLWGNILMRDPSKYETAVDQLKKTIAAQRLNGDQGAAYERNAIQELGADAMRGMAKLQPKLLVQQINAGAWDDKVDPATLLRAKGDAEIAIDEQQRLTQQQMIIDEQKRQAHLQAQLKATVPQLEQGVLPDAEGKINGVPVPGPRAAGQYDAGADIEQRIAEAKRIGGDYRAIWSGTQENNQMLLASLQPQKGKVQEPGSLDRYQKALAQVQAKDALFAKDPATGAIRTNPAVENSWRTYQQTSKAVAQDGAPFSDLVKARDAAIALSQQEQARQGVPEDAQRILPDFIRDPLLNAIQGAVQQGDAQQMTDTVDAVVSHLGPDAVGDLVAGGAPAIIVPLAAASAPLDAPWKGMLARAIGQPSADLEDAARQRGGTKDAIDAEINLQQPNIVPALPNNFIKAIQLVAMQQVARGQPLGDAVAFAEAPFVREYTFHANRSVLGYVVPRPLDGDKVAYGLNAIAANIGGLVDLAPEDDQSGNPISAKPAYRTQQEGVTLATGRYGWINNEHCDGVYLIYETGDKVLQIGPDGMRHPVEVKFTQALAVIYQPGHGGHSAGATKTERSFPNLRPVPKATAPAGRV